jgi:hypothetical protein
LAQKFCTVCGVAIPEGMKFCEKCESPVIQDTPAPVIRPDAPVGPGDSTSPVIPSGRSGKGKTLLIIGAAIILVLAAGAFFFVLPKLPGAGSSPGFLPGSGTITATAMPIATSQPPATSPITSMPTQEPDPFPGALALKELFAFGSGNVASEAIVYNYWINDTYEWHNDRDNHYYVQKPHAGNKYLFVFVHLVNNGDTRVWFPPASSVVVHYNNALYYQDLSHYKPDKASDIKATPVEVKEIQYFHKLNGDEYVEDFGFSHGTELAYLYPGKSNAVDGYIVYEVPLGLTPDKTYVEISFNGQDRGVWKLG